MESKAAGTWSWPFISI